MWVNAESSQALRCPVDLSLLLRPSLMKREGMGYPLEFQRPLLTWEHFYPRTAFKW